MAFDGIFMSRIVKLLNRDLASGKVNKIYQISNYELLFQIRANRNKHQLLISAHPNYARITITYQNYPKATTPSHLTMLLRKHLEGYFIQSIFQYDLERIIKIHFQGRNDLGDVTNKFLYVEIMGKHSNIILSDESNTILDSIKRISPSMNSIRYIQPGASYQLPPLQEGKKNLFTEEKPIIYPKMYTQYSGMSPLLAKELTYRQEQSMPIVKTLEELQSSETCFIHEYEGKEEFHLIALTHFQTTGLTYHLYDGMDQFFFTKEEKDRIKQQTADLMLYLKKEYQKNIKKLHKLEQTLYESENSQEYKIKGDLLFSSLHLIKKGMTSVTVDNYYDNSTMKIELDPRYDGKTNAKQYYNKYQKAKNSISILNQQIRLTKEEIEYFDTLLTQMENASFIDALEIKEELENAGYLRKRASKQKNKPNKKPNFSTYLTKDGIEIYVGKNNLQNDYLTFKFSSKNYLWFHAKDMPGSHVVVNQEQLDEYTMRLVSKLAAYFSKGKLSSSVPVNYTHVKQLKKTNSGKSGQVILGNYQTIYIDPDKSVLDEIIKKDA